jgi:hypothetical protein
MSRIIFNVQVNSPPNMTGRRNEESEKETEEPTQHPRNVETVIPNSIGLEETILLRIDITAKGRKTAGATAVAPSAN